MSFKDKKKSAFNADKSRKIKEIKNNKLNKECFDCRASNPEYISLNNGIFICKDCLKIHNTFPKQISNTLKNNLSSLNKEELQYIYLGGNQKLSEFVNYEYPQLQKFKINILYQTKAMQYYRNNLHFLVNGGIKPIKPSEKINAYELININGELNKNEKINNFKSLKNKKRNKSETKLDFFAKKIEKVKNKANKAAYEKRKKISFKKNEEDSLKRYCSFYKEMNRIFGAININFEKKEKVNRDIYNDYNEKSIHKIKENFRKKSEYNLNNVKKQSILNKDEIKNNSSFVKKQLIERIYNNNYFTLSATKNIFMFPPNKDSIIHKHRKINTNINENNIKNNPLNKVNEIYFKPKIPYLININKKKENNINIIKENELNINDEKKRNTHPKSIKINTSKNKKSNNNELLEDISLRKKIKKEELNENIKENDIKKSNENTDLNIIKVEQSDINSIFKKKIISKLMKKDKLIKENENNLFHRNSFNANKRSHVIFYRNERRKKNLKQNSIINKKELKDDNSDIIINLINNANIQNISNEINVSKEDSKNKTFSEIRENNIKNKFINYNNLNDNKNDYEKKNVIKIKRDEDNGINLDLNYIHTKETTNNENQKIKKEEKNDNKINELINNNLKKENIEDDNKENKMKEETKEKCFIDKRKEKINKFLGNKVIEKNNEKGKEITEEKDNKNNKDINKKEEEKIKKIKKVEIKDYNSSFNNQKNEIFRIFSSFSKLDLKIDNKIKTIENSKDIHYQNSETSSTIFEKKEVSKNQDDNNINNSYTQKISIRNKYKMKKMKEFE